jgi:hypothetical protein
LTTLKPQIPFIWPDPHALEEPSIYEYYPPYGNLIFGATWAFGVLPALTARGVRVLDEWLVANPDLKLSVIIVVYPACSTRQSDLAQLRALAARYPDRLLSRILPLEEATDRSINAVCFSAKESDSVHMVIGPTEELGLGPWREGHLNFALQANPSLVESFRLHFDWLWGRSCDVQESGVTEIPELVLPPGSEEGSRTWQSYLNELRSNRVLEDVSGGDAHVAIESAETNPESPEVAVEKSATERLGVPALDKLTEFVAGLYGKGALVTINKRSKIPPLDAPLDPYLFGDKSELRRGSVTRRVSMRISVIDEKTLREIEGRKKSVWALLTRFSFGLADSMRWMPSSARELFEAEVERLNAEGQRLIAALLKGDVDTFLNERQQKLVVDLNTLHTALGLPGTVASDVVEVVIQSLKERLNKAQSTSFIPELSYSEMGFRATENDFANPWGQAVTLLSDIAAYPRRAILDRFFSRDLKSSRQEILTAMNVADDALLRDPSAKDVEERCEEELDLLFKIQDAPIKSKLQCGLVWEIIRGTAIPAIEEELKKLKKETA